LDADALNVLGANPTVLRQRKGPAVLTPHPGEFGRLIGQGTARGAGQPAEPLQSSSSAHRAAYWC